MDTRLKIATGASFISVLVAALALSLAPAGATGMMFWQKDDNFNASNKVISEVEAKNYVDVNQGGTQNANTGNVTASHMDDIKGTASTGNASNTASSSVAVAVANHAVAPAVAAPAVPALDLDNFDNVTLTNFVKTEVSSKNDVDVNNGVTQNATSGSVNINCLDDASGMTTGNASNSLTLSTSVTASN